MRTDEIDPWPVDLAGCKVGLEDSELRVKAVRWASNILWKRTGRQYGVKTATVRICPPCTCNCAPCACGPRSLLHISPRLPITEVVSVTNVRSGVAIDPARYTVVNDHYIGLTDYVNCGWTIEFQSDLEIEFKSGVLPDIEGLEACAELACEKLKQWTGQTCRLPTQENALGGYRRGRNGRRDVILFGIPAVDQFILNQPIAPGGMMDPAQPMPYSVS